LAVSSVQASATTTIHKELRQPEWLLAANMLEMHFAIDPA